MRGLACVLNLGWIPSTHYSSEQKINHSFRFRARMVMSILCSTSNCRLPLTSIAESNTAHVLLSHLTQERPAPSLLDSHYSLVTAPLPWTTSSPRTPWCVLLLPGTTGFPGRTCKLLLLHCPLFPHGWEYLVFWRDQLTSISSRHWAIIHNWNWSDEWGEEDAKL